MVMHESRSITFSGLSVESNTLNFEFFQEKQLLLSSTSEAYQSICMFFFFLLGKVIETGLQKSLFNLKLKKKYNDSVLFERPIHQQSKKRNKAALSLQFRCTGRSSAALLCSSVSIEQKAPGRICTKQHKDST